MRITIDTFIIEHIEHHNMLTRTQCDAWLAAIQHDIWWWQHYGLSGHKPPAYHIVRAECKHAV